MSAPQPSFTERGGLFVAAQLPLFLLIYTSGRAARPVHPFQRLIGTILLFGGATLGAASLQQLGRNLTIYPEPVQDVTLVTSGLYRRMRHPIYSAVLLLSTGWTTRQGSRSAALWTLALFILFELKTSHEETALQVRFPEYAQYRQQVRKYFPGVY